MKVFYDLLALTGRNLINLILLVLLALCAPQSIATASTRFARPLNLIDCSGKTSDRVNARGYF